tara:strand:+ start:87 stop:617 length:531 start_codon:yes stop_codon:yes gene_type:complete
MTAAFFAGCLTATSLGELEWETLAAGGLAVIAGAFALQAAKIQIKHQRELEEEKKVMQVRRFLQELESTLQFFDGMLQTIRDNKYQMTRNDKRFLSASFATFNVSNAPPEVPDQLAEVAISIKRDANLLREVISLDTEQQLDDSFLKLDESLVRLIDRMLANAPKLTKAIADHLNN